LVVALKNDVPANLILHAREQHPVIAQIGTEHVINLILPIEEIASIGSARQGDLFRRQKDFLPGFDPGKG